MDGDDLGALGMTVNGRRIGETAGARLANDPLTRLYLDAGIRLLERELLDIPALDSLWEHPLKILSRKMVVQESHAIGYAGGTEPGDGSFRDRWPRQADYVADLVRYAMRPQLWQAELNLADRAQRPLIDATEFSRIVHAVAYQDTMLVNSGSVAMRFHLLATAVAHKYTAVRTALTDIYATVTARWHRTYTAMFTARKMHLRPDVSVEELTVLLTALAEGLNKRYLGDPTMEQLLIDHQTKRTLLGKGALLLVAGAAGDGTGTTLEQHVNTLFHHPPR